MVEVHGLGDARQAIHPLHPGLQRRVVAEPPEVALEGAVVGHVEAHAGHEQADVGRGEALAQQERAARGETALERVQLLEDAGHGLLVGLLGGGEAGPVDAVVELLVHRPIEGGHLVQQVDRAQPRCRLHVRVEGVVEHGHQVGRLVADDGVLARVPQHRDRRAPGVVRVGAGVELVQVGGAEERVAVGAWEAAEAPALVAEHRVHHRHRQHVVKLLELAHHQHARGPRADQGHVEPVAAGLGGEAGLAARAGAAVGLPGTLPLAVDQHRSSPAEVNQSATLTRPGVARHPAADAGQPQAAARARVCRRARPGRRSA